MATQEVLNGLTDVIQTCLEDKVQAGFDANAQLSIEIMREIAGALETKVNAYTDVEINTLKTLIENGGVDLGPFTDFMNTMKTMLDGDENTEGYQVFEQLIVDTANNKTGVINATNSITQIQTTLNNFQTTISDHATRIAELEAEIHQPMDCEGCQDEIIGLIDSSFEDGCNESTAAIEAYRTAESSRILTSFIAEMNPSTVVADFTYNYEDDSTMNGWVVQMGGTPERQVTPTATGLHYYNDTSVVSSGYLQAHHYGITHTGNFRIEVDLVEVNSGAAHIMDLAGRLPTTPTSGDPSVSGTLVYDNVNLVGAPFVISGVSTLDPTVHDWKIREIRFYEI